MFHSMFRRLGGETRGRREDNHVVIVNPGGAKHGADTSQLIRRFANFAEKWGVALIQVLAVLILRP